VPRTIITPPSKQPTTAAPVFTLGGVSSVVDLSSRMSRGVMTVKDIIRYILILIKPATKLAHKPSDAMVTQSIWCTTSIPKVSGSSAIKSDTFQIITSRYCAQSTCICPSQMIRVRKPSVVCGVKSGHRNAGYVD